ncbi:hypothetical protein GCM10022293_42440 [Azospirillum formosense]
MLHVSSASFLKKGEHSVDVARQYSPRRGKDASPIAPLTLEAVRRIDAIFDLERALNGKPAAARLVARQEHGIALLGVTP